MQSVQALFKHISTTAFPEHLSVMQKLAAAEQCHGHAAQLLAEAQLLRAESPSNSRVVQHISELCTHLQLKMDSFAGHVSHIHVSRCSLMLVQSKTSFIARFVSVCCSHVNKLPKNANNFKVKVSSISISS
jgi:hypothetical protein